MDVKISIMYAIWGQEFKLGVITMNIYLVLRDNGFYRQTSWWDHLCERNGYWINIGVLDF